MKENIKSNKEKYNELISKTSETLKNLTSVELYNIAVTCMNSLTSPTFNLNEDEKVVELLRLHEALKDKDVRKRLSDDFWDNYTLRLSYILDMLTHNMISEIDSEVKSLNNKQE